MVRPAGIASKVFIAAFITGEGIRDESCRPASHANHACADAGAAVAGFVISTIVMVRQGRRSELCGSEAEPESRHMHGCACPSVIESRPRNLGVDLILRIHPESQEVDRP